MAEGMSQQEAIEAARAMTGQDEPETLLLPLRELPLIRLALKTHGQWRMVPVGLGGAVPVALDLVAVDVAARWLGITPDARLFDGLSIMEREALKLKRAER